VASYPDWITVSLCYRSARNWLQQRFSESRLGPRNGLTLLHSEQLMTENNVNSSSTSFSVLHEPRLPTRRQWRLRRPWCHQYACRCRMSLNYMYHVKLKPRPHWQQLSPFSTTIAVLSPYPATFVVGKTTIIVANVDEPFTYSLRLVQAA